MITSPRTEASPREPLRGLLATLCLFTGLTAIAGGAELIASPDGSSLLVTSKLLAMPLSMLQYSPFRDFLVPALLLAGVVGAANTVAGVLVLRRHALADRAAFVSGGILVAWLVVEVILLRRTHWLQALYLLIGLSIQMVAFARARPRGSGLPPRSDVEGGRGDR